MYAFTPDQTLCLVYEDFYLAIGYIFYDGIKKRWRRKKSLLFIICGIIKKRSLA